MRADCGSYFITMYIKTKKHKEKENIITEKKRKKEKTTKLNRLYAIVFEK